MKCVSCKQRKRVIDNLCAICYRRIVLPKYRIGRKKK